jgi:hypothetical protein
LWTTKNQRAGTQIEQLIHKYLPDGKSVLAQAFLALYPGLKILIGRAAKEFEEEKQRHNFNKQVQSRHFQKQSWPERFALAFL